MAHSRVRNSFRIPEMDLITEMNERLLEEVMAPGFNQRLGLSISSITSRIARILTENIEQKDRPEYKLQI